MSGQQPRAVTRVIWVLVGVVSISGLTALLTAVFEDDLISSWAVGRSDTGSVQPPAFVPVAIVMFVVIALLAAVLVLFFRHGHGWARRALVALAAMLALATLAGFRTSPPAPFVVLSVLSLALDLALVACLCHPEARAYTAGPREVGAGARS